MATVDLGALKDKPNSTNEPIEVETAFLVVIRRPGEVLASPDINAPIAPSREPTVDEMQMAARKVADDIQASKTAQIVQIGMQQAAAQAMSAAEHQRLSRSLKL